METLTLEIVTDIAGLVANPAKHLGYTDWTEMTQEQVNTFDFQPIPFIAEPFQVGVMIY